MRRPALRLRDVLSIRRGHAGAAVEGEESILAACDRHADWLRGYVQEDDAVQVIDELPLLAGERFAEEDLADPA
jgi:hypothetical protein